TSAYHGSCLSVLVRDKVLSIRTLPGGRAIPGAPVVVCFHSRKQRFVLRSLLRVENSLGLLNGALKRRPPLGIQRIDGLCIAVENVIGRAAIFRVYQAGDRFVALAAELTALIIIVVHASAHRSGPDLIKLRLLFGGQTEFGGKYTAAMAEGARRWAGR